MIRLTVLDDVGFLVEIVGEVADGGPEVFVEIELVAGDEAVEGIGADAVELLGGLFDVGVVSWRT